MYIRTYLSIYLSVYLSNCLTVYLLICLLFIRLLFICLLVYLSICLSVYLSICLSVFLSISLYSYIYYSLNEWVYCCTVLYPYLNLHMKSLGITIQETTIAHHALWADKKNKNILRIYKTFYTPPVPPFPSACGGVGAVIPPPLRRGVQAFVDFIKKFIFFHRAALCPETINIIDHRRTTFILSTWNHERCCSVRILYAVYSVAKL